LSGFAFLENVFVLLKMMGILNVYLKQNLKRKEERNELQ